MTDIPEGYEIIAGRSSRNARAALDAAAAVGLDPQKVVKAVNEGYLVPTVVAAAYRGEIVGEPLDGEPTPPVEVALLDGSPAPVGEDGIPILFEATPASDWKNADIKAWAEDHAIDLGSATTKADMLAAIAATDKEE